MTVQVVTGDEIFARMVIRLLEGAGIAAVHAARRGGFFDRAVVDLDFVKSPRLGERCVTVSSSPAAGADLTRPFLVDSLLRLAVRAFGEGDPGGITGAVGSAPLANGTQAGETGVLPDLDGGDKQPATPADVPLPGLSELSDFAGSAPSADATGAAASAEADGADGADGAKRAGFTPPLPTARGVRMGGREIPLSQREQALYALLYEHRGSAVSREEIRQAVFPGSFGNEPEVYISYLRAKLDYTAGRRIIRTVRGKGYVID